MFAIRFVPDGNNFNTLRRNFHASAKLCFRLMRKSIAHAERILFQSQYVVHILLNSINELQK
jgi:hypothetical protein